MVKSSAAGPARTAPPDPATTNQACRPGGAELRPRDAERATPRSSPRRLARATPATQTPEPSPGTTSESPRPDPAGINEPPAHRPCDEVLAQDRVREHRV